MISPSFNINPDNEWVFKIVNDSPIVQRIMEDVAVEIPELIRSAKTKEVRRCVVNYICNPTEFKTYTAQTFKLIRILKRHLNETKEFAAFERIATKLRSNVRNAVRKLNISSNFEDLLGCSSDELITYLENQFGEGMTWDNYGLKGWHIDHIKPLCSFKLDEAEEIRSATHYSNLRPLWAKDNLKKASQDRKQSVRRKNITLLKVLP